MNDGIWNGLVIAMLTAGITIGFIIFKVIPWLWVFVKPWLHAITA